MRSANAEAALLDTNVRLVIGNCSACVRWQLCAGQSKGGRQSRNKLTIKINLTNKQLARVTNGGKMTNCLLILFKQNINSNLRGLFVSLIRNWNKTQSKYGYDIYYHQNIDNQNIDHQNIGMKYRPSKHRSSKYRCEI